MREIAQRVAARGHRSSSTRRTSTSAARRSFRELDAHPNVIIGRTFAKAHGLAGLRAGCLIGDPERLDADPQRRAAVTASACSRSPAGARRCAIASTLAWYRTQVEESRELLYAACERLTLPYWKSAGNFVLINVSRAGDPAEIVEAFADARHPGPRSLDAIPAAAAAFGSPPALVRHTEIVIEALEGLCAVP